MEPTAIVDVSGLTPDQQFQAGLFCGSVHATPTTPISPTGLCPGTMYGSNLVKIPAPGTENDDHNPPRVQPRHLFDIAVGDDNLFNGDRYIEEPPFFYWDQMGSMVYAKAARARSDDIKLMVSLEMLGCYSDEPGSQSYPMPLRFFYPDRGNFIAFVANLRSRKPLHRLVAAFRAHSDFPAESLATFEFIPGVAWSDQLSFWREGYPGLMVTDTAFYRYAYYHTALDTPEKLNYPAMARVVLGLQQAVAAVAS